jgi:hypothetical protein
MIVRISSEGQYRLPEGFLDRLNALDDRVVKAVVSGDEVQFHDLFTQMLSIVRKEGKPLGPREIAQSALILPAPDITLHEARELFTKEGLIPG